LGKIWARNHKEWQKMTEFKQALVAMKAKNERIKLMSKAKFKKGDTALYLDNGAIIEIGITRVNLVMSGSGDFVGFNYGTTHKVPCYMDRVFAPCSISVDELKLFKTKEDIIKMLKED
jgi:hypothetical protein